jgi:T-complex protein 1 subunit gamma
VILTSLQKVLDDALAYLNALSTPIDPKDDEILCKSAAPPSARSSWRNSQTSLPVWRWTPRLVRTPEDIIDLNGRSTSSAFWAVSCRNSYMIQGVRIEKSVLHSAICRRIEYPKVFVLHCGLEYQKGESITNIEITGEDDDTKMLAEEETQVHDICQVIIATGCDLVWAEKGVSDHAQHYLSEVGVAALRHFQKFQLERIAVTTGATVVTNPRNVLPEDLGRKCCCTSVGNSRVSGALSSTTTRT